MPKRCRTTGGRLRRSTKRQKSGIFPLAALIPALVAGGKPWLWELPVERPVTVPRKHWKQLLLNEEDDKRLSSRRDMYISNHAQEEDTTAATCCLAEETNSAGWCRISPQTASGGQDRRRDEYVFVWNIPFVCWSGIEIDFTSYQRDKRQRQSLSSQT